MFLWFDTPFEDSGRATQQFGVETIRMRIVNPLTGKTYFRKVRKRIDELGHARELTFSCYKRFKFLDRERTCQWFIDSLLEARKEFAVDIWAYVIMPEHVHLLLYPRDETVQVGRVAGSIKESVARPAIQYLRENAPVDSSYHSSRG